MKPSDGVARWRAQSCSSERAGVLQGLGSAGDIDRSDARDLLARLYCSHTYREIRALADPERDLPATMLPIDDAARGAAAHGYAKSAKVANDMLSNFCVEAAHAAAWSGDYRRPLDERWARNVDVMVETERQEIQSPLAVEQLRGLVDFARDVLKLVTLINGGAAIALLAFAGVVLSTQSSDFKPRWKSNYLCDWSIHRWCTSILNWSCDRI